MAFERKNNHLQNYDYALIEPCHVTICTADNKQILASKDARTLTNIGRIVESELLQLSTRYPGILIEKYVIMPNHVHILLRCESHDKTYYLPEIIRQFKRRVSVHTGPGLWEKSYYDHVIRNEQDYLEVWNYIENNPVRWRIRHGIEET